MARLGRHPATVRRLSVLVTVAVLVLTGLVVAWVGQRAAALTLARPRVVWALHPGSNTVTIRLAPGGGPLGRRFLADSHLVVSEDGRRHLRRTSPDGGMVRVPVPPGRRAHLVVVVEGPQSFRRTLTVTVPQRLRVVASRNSGGLLIRASGPLRQRPGGPLCGTDEVSFPASAEVAVAKSPDPCRARLRLTALTGERAVVPVTIPALPEVPLYDFASPAGRAIYITVDDGWTPSPQVLAIMDRTHVPVTAFLIEQAAQRNLVYWRAFDQAGGTIGDHTVSHPDLTKLTLGQATAQWGQARQALGRWLGRPPLMGRPPDGATDRTVQAAAYRAGLKTLVGWSAVVTGDRIHTWDGKRLEPGEIVLLHWVRGLGHQLAMLLAAIHARHLSPKPLTPASFAGSTPQSHSRSGE